MPYKPKRPKSPQKKIPVPNTAGKRAQTTKDLMKKKKKKRVK